MNEQKWLRQTAWLLPGLAVKRWVILILVGLASMILGLAVFMNLQPITGTIKLLTWLGTMIPSSISGPIAIGVGVLLVFFGLRNVMQTVGEAYQHDSQWDPDILEVLYRRNKLGRGPNIVAIGGGTGLSTLLRGLKLYTNNITAVVTVGDDGGSSGRLREEQGIIPPGDIRNCIAALANEEQLITSLFQYRFQSGQGLEGHSFGNLFLTAMCRVTGDMMSAIKESSKVLNIRGQVLPSTLDNVKLVATMEDGSTVVGESQIPEVAKTGNPIQHLTCEPSCPQPLPEVLQAIERADLIILGPGSLYTSVLPNLLIGEIAEAVSKCPAPKVYVCNVMTQPGETDGYSVGDHLQTILEHCPYPNMVDAVVVNTKLSESLLQLYQAHGYEAVTLDQENCERMGISVIQGNLLSDTNTKTIRHNPKQLARTIVRWLKKEYPKRARLLSEPLKTKPLRAKETASIAAASTSSPSL